MQWVCSSCAAPQAIDARTLLAVCQSGDRPSFFERAAEFIAPSCKIAVFGASTCIFGGCLARPPGSARIAPRLHPRGWVGISLFGVVALATARAHAEPTASFDTTPREPEPTPAPARPAQSPPPPAVQPAPAAPSASPAATNARPPQAAASVEPPPPVEASEPPRFGDAGRWVITAALDLSFSHAFNDSNSATDVSLHPSIDYFAAPHVSVGAELTFGYSHVSYTASSTTTTQFGGGVLVGYDLRLGERVSLWPRVSLGYGTAHAKAEYAPVYSYSDTRRAGSTRRAVAASRRGYHSPS
jgi:hypothetical protein